MHMLYVVTQRLVWLAVKFFTKTFIRYSETGKENLRRADTPLLIISNHKTYWDPLVIGAMLPFFSRRLPWVGFMAADRFSKNPLMRAFFWCAGVGFARQGAGLAVSLAYPRNVLKNKGIFLIFPLGRIVHNDEGPLPRPGRGAAVLAGEFPRVTVLPVHIDTSRDRVSFFEFLARKRDLRVVVGETFTADGSKSADETSRLFVRKIMELKTSIQYPVSSIRRAANCELRNKGAGNKF